MPNDDGVLLTTTQVSTQLGTTDSNVRTIKSRNKQQLIEGEHWVTDAGRTLWSAAGVTVLQQLLTTDTPALQPDTEALQVDSGNGCRFDEPIDELLQQQADAIALSILQQRLPGLVEASLRRMLQDPTEIDCQQLQNIFKGFGLVQTCSALAGGLSAALSTSQQSMKQLEGSNDGR